MDEEVSSALAHLRNIFDEGEELNEVLDKLCNNLNDAAQAFPQLAADKNFSALQAAAHKLKSETAFCQLKSLTALLQQIEEGAKRKDESLLHHTSEFAQHAKAIAGKL